MLRKTQPPRCIDRKIRDRKIVSTIYVIFLFTIFLSAREPEAGYVR
jgi:hypothetical protein